ncbi:hypothetical protein SAMN05216226_103251 [Halovenus aranensis]|uniref:DUF8131 domain-containing protein n=1 Tax=Halovenus aranensis TaxID=890420 RepID=A0A1G8TU00_9EURY|nr:hypothetical protein [Halovenus aranensis]SDJ44953.1 hypothetical protein SAMN05216226_103251 [Halovenus aranensis]
MALSPRRVGLLSLLALVPVGIFLVGSVKLAPLAAGLTALNVVLITTSLYHLFGDAPTDLGKDSLPV